jgi:hypothetical protein
MWGNVKFLIHFNRLKTPLLLLTACENHASDELQNGELPQGLRKVNDCGGESSGLCKHTPFNAERHK